MKTNEELNALRNEVETLRKKLAELNEGELEQVTGGADLPVVDRHNERRPLTGGLEIDLNGHNVISKDRP